MIERIYGTINCEKTFIKRLDSLGGFIMDEIEKTIRKVVGTSDYQKGLNYDEDLIDYVGVTKIEGKKRFQFLVESESSYRKYMVQIHMENEKIAETFCTCPKFSGDHSCKHIAACLICYSDKLLNPENTKSVEQKTKQLFQKLQNEFQSDLERKEEVQIIPYLSIETSYYYDTIALKVKIGKDKLYSLLGKYNSFRYAKEEEEPYSFGANFTYDPKKHFFSERSLRLFQIINSLISRRYSSGNSIVLDDESLKEILKLYPEGIYVDENKQKSNIENNFPMELGLSKENHKYKMNFKNDLNELIKLTEDYEYVFFENTIYHLNKKQRFLLEECLNHRLSELVFEENDFVDFQKSVLRVVKDSVKLEDRKSVV